MKCEICEKKGNKSLPVATDVKLDNDDNIIDVISNEYLFFCNEHYELLSDNDG